VGGAARGHDLDPMTRILVVSDGAVGSRMAAPGIRAFNIARVLHEQLPGARVTLALPPGYPSDISDAAVAFEIARPASGELSALARSHDVIVAGRLPAPLIAATADKRVVLDLYSPLITESANISRWFGKKHRRAWLDMKRKHLLLQLQSADLVLCANERQRDFVAGMMCTYGMITRRMFEDDPRLTSRIAVAPLGIRPKEPGPRQRGELASGISDDDYVLLWNGTIIEWYDVQTLLLALDKLRHTHDNVKLVFLGTDYPQAPAASPSGTMGSGAVQAAMDLASELQLLDSHVVFNHGWANDETTERFLLGSDVGVSTYFDNLETHFSFRVRYLDLLWASLPIVCTRGDVVSEMVQDEGLGAALPAGDVDALAAALDRLADPALRAKCRENMARVRSRFRWEHTLEPLVQFCAGDNTRRGVKPSQIASLAVRGLDWFAAEAYEKARFAYRKKLLRSGHSGLE
jgi:glycosyltransferase involved in cell wall biosynthesis